MPHLPRNIGEQIAEYRSKRRRFMEMLRRAFGVKFPTRELALRNPKQLERDRV